MGHIKPKRVSETNLQMMKILITIRKHAHPKMIVPNIIAVKNTDLATMMGTTRIVK
jgi:hypothetical protein